MRGQPRVLQCRHSSYFTLPFFIVLRLLPCIASLEKSGNLTFTMHRITTKLKSLRILCYTEPHLFMIDRTRSPFLCIVPRPVTGSNDIETDGVYLQFFWSTIGLRVLRQLPRRPSPAS